MTAPVAQTSPVRSFLRLVAIEHSVFALPFAYLAALTAMTRAGTGIVWSDLLLITIAMVGAATSRSNQSCASACVVQFGVSRTYADAIVRPPSEIAASRPATR